MGSERQSDSPMLYNIPVIRSTSLMLKQQIQKIRELDVECTELHKKVEASRTKLHATNRALRDITNQNHQLEKKCELLKAKASKLKERNVQLETEFQELEEESDSDTSFEAVDEPTGTLQDIIGHRKYSPAIRKLYYTLLADQVPASKIADIIKTVLKCFNPSLNVEELRLPKKTCAGYMRKEELKTINDAHKAHVLCEDASKGKGISLNTDGTTKHQRKLGGAIVNGLVDGKAITAVEDISKEFEKLRRVAEMLGLPNAHSINWTLVKSSTSDSALRKKTFEPSHRRTERK